MITVDSATGIYGQFYVKTWPACHCSLKVGEGVQLLCRNRRHDGVPDSESSQNAYSFQNIICPGMRSIRSGRGTTHSGQGSIRSGRGTTHSGRGTPGIKNQAHTHNRYDTTRSYTGTPLSIQNRFVFSSRNTTSPHQAKT
jgi:hypothetical protein